MSWLFSRALVEEYSRGTSLAGLPCAPLSVMPTQHKFLRNGKTMESSSLSRFGLMCAVLTEGCGEELLMSFLVASRARTYLRQEKEREFLGIDLDCGLKWQELSVRYDLDSSSWKTARCLSQEVLPWSSVTLPKWGMCISGGLFQLESMAHVIKEKGSGLWLPTPSGVNRGSSHVIGRLDEWGGSGNPLRGTKIGKLRCASFEEWMMGWPTGWSALTPLEMDKFQLWRRQHFQCLAD